MILERTVNELFGWHPGLRETETQSGKVQSIRVPTDRWVFRRFFRLERAFRLSRRRYRNPEFLKTDHGQLLPNGRRPALRHGVRGMKLSR